MSDERARAEVDRFKPDNIDDVLRLYCCCVVLSGCIQSSSIQCGELTCASDTQCIAGTCVFDEQVEACANLAELDVCSFNNVTGVCRGSACIESRCGNELIDPGEECDDGNLQPGDTCNPVCQIEACRNGYLDPDEQCDDGNALSHDGCSSGCTVEAATWHELPPAWRPRRRPGVAFDSVRGRTVLFGGNAPDRRNDTWELVRTNGNDRWTEVVTSAAPTPRAEPAMAFDSTRGVVVLFGGYGPNIVGENDTWEYNGTTWTQVLTATSPPKRGGAGLAFDASRARIVMFGGRPSPASALYNDTWEYDGVNWAKKTFSMPQPGATVGSVTPALVYDSVRNVVVLTAFGTTQPTWEYAGGEWTNVQTTAVPFNRQNHSLVYDAARVRTVLVGGFCVHLNYAPCDDLWEYDGANWVRRSTSSPGPIAEAGFVYDADLARSVLVAGRGTAGARDETQLYIGGTWSVLDWAQTPLGRVYPVLAYDPAKARSMVFSGELYDGTFTTELWTFERERWVPDTTSSRPFTIGGTWQGAFDETNSRLVMFGSCTPWMDQNACTRAETWALGATGWTAIGGQQPPARALASTAFFGGTGEVLLFGGQRGGIYNDLLGDTWRLAADGWHQVLGAGPPSRQAAAMAFDRRRGKLVLFGGAGITGELADTWESDGGAWTQVTPIESPPSRLGAAMTYDAIRERLVLFGGERYDGESYQDLWEYDGVTWRRVPTAGISPPARAYHAMTYDPAHRRILLVGSTQAWDTWSYRYESSWPDEDCVATGDEDDDGALDCADPDCELEPMCP